MRGILILFPESNEANTDNGGDIRTKSSTKSYDEGWDRIFGKVNEGAQAKTDSPKPN